LRNMYELPAGVPAGGHDYNMDKPCIENAVPVMKLGLLPEAAYLCVYQPRCGLF
jgi:hypothetical protein